MTKQYLYGEPIVDPSKLMTGSSLQNLIVNASNVALASFFSAGDVAAHGAIVGCLLNCITVTSPPVYRVSLQGINSRGTPDGTVKGGASPASLTFTPTANLLNLTFSNAYTPSTGDALALVCEYSSGTIDASHVATFTRYVITAGGSSLPYTATETAGTWAASVNTPSLAPVYNDGYVGRGFCPCKTAFNNVAASTSYGTLWTPDVACVFTGVVTWIKVAAGSVITVTLYEGSSTTISSLTVASQVSSMNCDLLIAATGGGLIEIPMPQYTMKAGTVYRLVITNSGTAYTTFPSCSFTTQAALQAYNGELAGTIGTTTTFTDYASGSDWRAFPVIPCIDSFSFAGGAFSSEMAGGFE